MTSGARSWFQYVRRIDELLDWGVQPAAATGESVAATSDGRVA